MELLSNGILKKLSPDIKNLVLERAELVELQIREVAYESNEPIENAYFPESGVISIVTPMSDGVLVEAATVGDEGMVGIPLILRARKSSTRAFCQIPGTAWRISADHFQYCLRSAEFTVLLLRYTQTFLDVLAQTSACNRLHSIEERCARWLLRLHDRVGETNDDIIPITQEFLAQMLGVRRTGVNLAAGILQRAGFITYVRGKITILDREGLEEVACECYRVARESFEALDSLDSLDSKE